MKTEYNPPKGAFYSQVDVPNHVVPGIMIGNDGKHFKRITIQSGTDYIWFDSERSIVEIWSWNKHNIRKARRLISSHIYKCPCPEYKIEIKEDGSSVTGPYYEVIRYLKSNGPKNITNFEKDKNGIVTLTLFSQDP